MVRKFAVLGLWIIIECGITRNLVQRKAIGMGNINERRVFPVAVIVQCILSPEQPYQLFYRSHVNSKSTDKKRYPPYSRTLCKIYGTWWHHQMETFSELRPFVRGISPSSMYSHHKCHWRGVWWFLCAPEQAVERIMELPVIYDATMVIVMLMQCKQIILNIW